MKSSLPQIINFFVDISADHTLTKVDILQQTTQSQFSHALDYACSCKTKYCNIIAPRNINNKIL